MSKPNKLNDAKGANRAYHKPNQTKAVGEQANLFAQESNLYHPSTDQRNSDRNKRGWEKKGRRNHRNQSKEKYVQRKDQVKPILYKPKPLQHMSNTQQKEKQSKKTYIQFGLHSPQKSSQHNSRQKAGVDYQSKINNFLSENHIMQGNIEQQQYHRKSIIHYANRSEYVEIFTRQQHVLNKLCPGINQNDIYPLDNKQQWKVRLQFDLIPQHNKRSYRDVMQGLRKEDKKQLILFQNVFKYQRIIQDSNKFIYCAQMKRNFFGQIDRMRNEKDKNEAIVKKTLQIIRKTNLIRQYQKLHLQKQQNVFNANLPIVFFLFLNQNFLNAFKFKEKLGKDSTSALQKIGQNQNIIFHLVYITGGHDNNSQFNQEESNLEGERAIEEKKLKNIIKEETIEDVGNKLSQVDQTIKEMEKELKTNLKLELIKTLTERMIKELKLVFNQQQVKVVCELLSSMKDTEKKL